MAVSPRNQWDNGGNYSPVRRASLLGSAMEELRWDPINNNLKQAIQETPISTGCGAQPWPEPGGIGLIPLQACLGKVSVGDGPVGLQRFGMEAWGHLWAGGPLGQRTALPTAEPRGDGGAAPSARFHGNAQFLPEGGGSSPGRSCRRAGAGLVPPPPAMAHTSAWAQSAGN